MPFSACPIAVEKAPADSVWEIISDPETYGTWSDAKTVSIITPGKAVSGQTIHAKATSPGISGDVTMYVEAVAIAAERSLL